jgi:putative signal transduction histidine kinase
VRDLTRAVMTAEQARLAHPGQSPLADELGAMTLAVRTAVEQLRSSLRAMNDAGGGGLDVLASSAPRPLEESLVQAVQVLAGRGTVLEVHGLEFLERQEVSPGVRQQLVRVLNELVSNMTKYAAASSTARLELDSDGHSLEAMVTNAVAEDVADGREAVLSSGLGLEGARRRVEALGGTLSASGGAGRWTVVLSVPLQAQ